MGYLNGEPYQRGGDDSGRGLFITYGELHLYRYCFAFDKR